MTGITPSAGTAAAIAATVLAGAASFAHVHRVVVRRDRAGVSTTSALVAVVTELTWIAYLVGGKLWWALPESVLLAATNIAVLGAVAAGRPVRRVPWCALGLWLTVILATALTSGRVGVGFVLTWSYVVEVAPAIWTAWTTVAPTGVVGVSWALTAVEGALWVWYGLTVGDRALSTFAALTIAAGMMMLGRKAVTASAGGRIERTRTAPALRAS